MRVFEAKIQPPTVNAEVLYALTLFLRCTGPLYYFHRDNNTIADGWTGDFFLNSSLYIEDNVKLSVVGEEYGGDVNRFLLVSYRRVYRALLVP